MCSWETTAPVTPYSIWHVQQQQQQQPPIITMNTQLPQSHPDIHHQGHVPYPYPYYRSKFSSGSGSNSSRKRSGSGSGSVWSRSRSTSPSPSTGSALETSFMSFMPSLSSVEILFPQYSFTPKPEPGPPLLIPPCQYQRQQQHHQYYQQQGQRLKGNGGGDPTPISAPPTFQTPMSVSQMPRLHPAGSKRPILMLYEVEAGV